MDQHPCRPGYTGDRMTALPFALTPAPTRFGLVVLQSDETIELDFHQMRQNCEIFVSRVPSGDTVTPESLRMMEAHVEHSAALFPTTCTLAAVGYGCTSGTAQIGADQIAAKVQAGHATRRVTNPLSALIAACDAMNIRNLALLSPYIETVSGRMRERLEDAGITTPTFGSFEEAEEAKVARIDGASIQQAARDLVQGSKTEGLFLSCTNLRTMDVITDLELELGIPVLSSNQVLAWYMGKLAKTPDAFHGPGVLFRA